MPKDADDLQEILDEQDAALHKAVTAYRKKSDRALHAAYAALLLMLGRRLRMKDGVIQSSIRNATVLSNLAQPYVTLLGDKGYRAALAEVRSALMAQPEFLSRVLEASAGSNPPVSDRETRIREFALNNTVSVLATEPGEAVQRAVNTVGESLLGMPLTALGDVLGRTIETLPSRLELESVTAISRYYRSMAKRAYDAIQEDTKTPIRYRYQGPSSGDPKIRPFCKLKMEQTEHGETWTSDEIDAMDNGQGLPVWTSNGGYNCRHNWIVAAGIKAGGAGGK